MLQPMRLRRRTEIPDTRLAGTSHQRIPLTLMYPDYHNGTVSGQPIIEAISDHAWLEGEFLETVQKRGGAIIEARGSSSAASAANGVVDTVRALTTATPAGHSFSVATASDGSYGVPEGLIFSYPTRCDGSGWSIVEGVEHGDFGRGKLEVTTKELESERDAVSSLLA